MMSGIRFEAGEILLVTIQFAGQEVSKTRPSLVISKFSMNPAHDVFIALAITSNPQNDPYMIKIMDSDILQGSLVAPSQVICNHIFTLQKNDVTKSIGKVRPEFFQKIKQILKTDILEI
ncbi:MAG: type II toxin-antitoxin system PemK/MazF family toxin [Nitrosotalea sp.]